MDFLKKRVKQYQEKKLNDALSKMNFHLQMKKNLEKELALNKFVESDKINKDLSHHTKMANIWKDNTEKIKNEISKL